jgi:hypothetical protein
MVQIPNDTRFKDVRSDGCVQTLCPPTRTVMRKLLKRATLMALLTGLASGYALAQQAFVPGLVKAEVYSNIGGTALSDLTNNAAYPSKPSSVSFVKFLEYPAGADDGTPPPGNVGSNYGVRISGFIIPTAAGSYTFYISADDNAAFFLSTDEDPAKRTLLAWEPAWNPVRSFEVDVNPGPGRPGCGTGDCENISVPVTLAANTRYYFEALMKEGGGGDNLAVAWSKDGGAIETFDYTDPVNGPLTTQLPIKALNLGTMADTTVSITRQPSDTAGAVGGTAQFSVGINGTPGVTYQWKKGGVDIAGATGPTYTTPPLVAGDNNAVYSVVVTKTGANSVTSSNATLRVASTGEVAGVALLETFTGMGGTAVPDGAALNALAAPSSFGTVTTANSDPFFGSVPNSDPSRENYLGKMSGYFVPTVTGTYDFFIRSDDASKLWINPVAGGGFPNPATDTAVAHEQSCCRAYFEPGEGANADGSFPTTETPISMTAGQKYAFVYYWKEGGGGDYGQIAVRNTADAGTVTAGSLQPIPAANLRALVVTGVGITANPQNVSVEENRPATFGVSTLSTPGQKFQWQSAPAGSSTFTAIANATNQTYRVTTTPRTANGTQYRVVVSNATDSQTSSPATLTITDDVTAPTIASVGSFNNRTGLIAYFNEPVNAAAGTYALNNGATISSSSQIGPSVVFIQTAAPLTAGSSYTLTVNNVRDLSGNGGNLVTPNTATFTASAAAPTPMTTGLSKYERWEGVSSIAQAITEVDARPADVVEPRAGFEAPVNAGATYGGRLSGWFIPPSDGNYIFSLATDDNGRLWLSTDSNPANKKLIGQETGWAASRAWTGIPDKISSTFAGTQWPGGNTITLKGGQPYYIETIWQEGGGGDNAAVTFWKEGQAMPANGTAPAITGANLVGNIAPDASGPPVVINGPTGRTFTKGDSITLTVEAIGQGPLTYQWIQNKRPIPGATSATYTIASADHTDIGDYSVLVSNPNGGVESNYRSADDSARLIMNGAYVIEAEDYNYEGGKHITAASTMPYLGDAYKSLLPTLDVDFFNSADQSGGSADADAYGPRMPMNSPGYIETKGDGDSINNAFNRNRGSFTLTANYALGWGDTGDWQNYTRTFPAGRYAIFAGVAQDGDPGADLAARAVSMNSTLSKVANPTVVDNSAVGVEGGAQGLTKLGVFQSPQSGAWSSNDIIPLTDETTGAPVEVQLSGTETLRWTLASGQDSDFLLLYCLTCIDTPPLSIAIARGAGGITLTYTGTLVASDTVNGTYAPVVGATSPYAVSPTGTMRFFQTRNP